MLMIAFESTSHTHQSALLTAYNNTNKRTSDRCYELD